MADHASVQTLNPVAPNGLSTFRLDVTYARLAPAFTDAGITPIVLKGPAFDQLLFDGTRAREYSDIDLLVDPAHVTTAQRLLARQGFRTAERRSVARRLARRTGLAIGTSSAHATTWIRERDRLVVDLHHTLPLVGTSAVETWRALRDHRHMIAVAETPVEALDRTASALLIALHAAHHGPDWRRARTDLQQACRVLERDCWRAAARLARDLQADRPMGIGLGTTPEGRALARELGLPTAPTPRYRVLWTGAAWLEQARARAARR